MRNVHLDCILVKAEIYFLFSTHINAQGFRTFTAIANISQLQM